MRKIVALLSMGILMVILFTACGSKEEEKGKSAVWTPKKITSDTKWNNDEPGMYGLNKAFVPWEELENRGYIRIEDGKLYTELSEEDGNIHTLDDVKGTLIIPDTVTSIGEEIFSHCHLINVVIPDSVKEIGANAFASTGLKDIKVPRGVEKIDSGAFSEISHIEYKGTATYKEDDKYWGAKSMN